jgi:AmpE protein
LTFICILLSLLLYRWWGPNQPLHRDAWYEALIERVDRSRWLDSVQLGPIIFALLVCLLLVSLGLDVLGSIARILLYLGNIALLIYCFGRGQFTQPAEQYIKAWRRDDWQAGKRLADKLQTECTGVEPGDWRSLNHAVVSNLAYRGFERIFVAIFWFSLTGIIIPLAYRLISIARDASDDEQTAELLTRAMWVIEWPAARVFGFSLALTGNFRAAFQRFSSGFWCTNTATGPLVLGYAASSLSISNEELVDPHCGERELTEIAELYSRTLILWMGVLAIISFFV